MYWKVDNSAINSYISQLETLGKKTDDMIGRAIYPAAGIVTNAIADEIRSIPVMPPNKRGTSSDKLTGLTSKQISGLLDGLGISKMENSKGYVNVKIGFDGYNTVKTKGYPNGQPNVMIARSVVSGTSFRVKNKFVDRAIQKSKRSAEKAIEKQIEIEIKKIVK